MKNQRIIDGLISVGNQVLPKGGHMWLYGSRARGDAHTTSDWDILILLDKDKIEGSDYDNFAFPLNQYGWATNLDISPVLYTIKEWKENTSPLFKHNVERDKIELI